MLPNHLIFSRFFLISHLLLACWWFIFFSFFSLFSPFCLSFSFLRSCTCGVSQPSSGVCWMCNPHEEPPMWGWTPLLALTKITLLAQQHHLAHPHVEPLCRRRRRPHVIQLPRHLCRDPWIHEFTKFKPHFFLSLSLWTDPQIFTRPVGRCKNPGVSEIITNGRGFFKC